MNLLIPLIVGIVAISLGSILGYYARQSIAKRNYRTIEAKIQKKISQARTRTEEILAGATKEANQILEATKKEEDERRD